MEVLTQRRTTAAEAGVHKPAGVPASVFDIAKNAPKPARKLAVRLNPAAVVVREGVPLPENPRAGGVSPYKLLLDKRRAGDSVELKSAHAKSLVKCANKAGIKVAVRALGDGVSGVWRL